MGCITDQEDRPAVQPLWRSPVEYAVHDQGVRWCGFDNFRDRLVPVGESTTKDGSRVGGVDL